MSANAITVKDVTKVYRLYDKPIDRLKESLSLTHKSYHKDFYALNGLSFNVEKGQTVACSKYLHNALQQRNFYFHHSA